MHFFDPIVILYDEDRNSFPFLELKLVSLLLSFFEFLSFMIIINYNYFSFAQILIINNYKKSFFINLVKKKLKNKFYLFIIRPFYFHKVFLELMTKHLL